MTFLRHGKDAAKYRAEEQHYLEEYTQLAEDLGAEVIQIPKPNVAKALIEVARERHITQLVLGQPNRNRAQAFLRGSVINSVLRFSSEFDVYLIPLSQTTEHPERPT
jgi:two-component system sensor histidine kinase KdpD